MNLPEAFAQKMRHLLGADYAAFLASYDRPRRRGLRIHAGKMTVDELVCGSGARDLAIRKEDRVPWTDNGFYIDAEKHPAQHPYYAAGLYYLQEPSAMYPAACLPVDAGDKVLDLCAAPGGKATELAVKLALADQANADAEPSDQGLLIANEIEPARAKALLRNLELTGMRNYCVLQETPERLAEAFPAYFDKILVDAPCSGEGMFRKEAAASALWSQERVGNCADLQKDILEQAYRMLRSGGTMVYSTCTFSPEEDEEQIAAFAARHPDMAVQKQEKLWPHKVEGEGHFLALLKKQASYDEVCQDGRKGRKGKKTSGKHAKEQAARQPDREQWAYLQQFLQDMETFSGLSGLKKEAVENRQDRAYLPVADPEKLAGLHVIRNGLYLGEWKKKRFEPSQALALALRVDGFRRAVRLAADSPEIRRFLQGESLAAADMPAALPDGWTLVCVETWPVGWGKAVNGILKNHIPAGWRR